MPNRPKPRPTPTPKAFDVFKPGKGRPSPTSRPVIVSSHPQVQDSMVVEKHGAPVANAHHAAAPMSAPAPAPAPTPASTPAPAPSHPRPVLKSLQPHQAVPPHAPHASSMHVTAAHHTKLSTHAAPTEESSAEAAPKKISRHGVTIAPPSASAAHKIQPVSGGAKPAAPDEPHLAALPITPMEQLSGTESKVEGKEELLAAMPIEIRRTIASSEGQQASEWNVPDFSSDTPTAPTAPTPAPAEQAAPAPAAPAEMPTGTPPAEQSVPPAATPAPAEQTAPAPAEQAAPAPAASKPDKPTQPLSSSQAASKERRRSEAAVFIIMFILFLLLGILVVLLFLSGSITL